VLVDLALSWFVTWIKQSLFKIASSIKCPTVQCPKMSNCPKLSNCTKNVYTGSIPTIPLSVRTHHKFKIFQSFFCTKKCGRPHLKNTFSLVRSGQTPLPPDCGRLLWTGYRTALYCMSFFNLFYLFANKVNREWLN